MKKLNPSTRSPKKLALDNSKLRPLAHAELSHATGGNEEPKKPFQYFEY